MAGLLCLPLAAVVEPVCPRTILVGGTVAPQRRMRGLCVQHLPPAYSARRTNINDCWLRGVGFDSHRLVARDACAWRRLSAGMDDGLARGGPPSAARTDSRCGLVMVDGGTRQ